MDMAALTHAAGSALIDLRLDDEGWEATETDYRTPGVVLVTLQRDREPLTCICPDPDSDAIGADCELCLIGGQPEPDYVDVEFTFEIGDPR